MADPIWPSVLRLSGAAGVSGAPQGNIVSFQPEIGTSIDRRRASSVTRTYDITLDKITSSEYNAFCQFVEETLISGTLPFVWVHPMTDKTAKVKLVQKQEMYKETRLTRDLYKIEFQISILRMIES